MALNCLVYAAGQVVATRMKPLAPLVRVIPHSKSKLLKSNSSKKGDQMGSV